MPAQAACQTDAEHRRREGQHRAEDQQQALGPQQVDQHEPGQERAEDAADHAPGVDLADRRAGPLAPPEPIDGELGDDRADRPHRQRRQEEHRGHHQQDPRRPGQRQARARQPGHRDRLAQDRLLAVQHAVRQPVRRRLQQQDREGQDRRDQEEPARLLLAPDEVGDLAPEVVAQAQAAEQDADDAGPAVDARPEVPGHQPAGHHLQRHEGQARDEREDRQVGQARPGPIRLGAGGRVLGRGGLLGEPGCEQPGDAEPRQGDRQDVADQRQGVDRDRAEGHPPRRQDRRTSGAIEPRPRKADASQPDRGGPDVADQHRRQQRQRRRDERHDRRVGGQVHQDEAGQERADDRADRAPEVDVADRAARLPRLLDGDLGDDRPDHPQDRGRDQEVERHDDDRPDVPGQGFEAGGQTRRRR